MGEIRLVDAGSIKVGNYVIIDGVACIVKRLDVSRPGKHGHAKCRIEASGLIDGTKKIIVKPSHDTIEIPIIEKKVAQVLSISDNKATVMDSASYETFDIIIPEEFKGKIKEGEEVGYWVILNDKVFKPK
ncbi:MAG: translation initiation factor IF-5A [Candidatus Nanoarchaeia archaeon]